MESAEAGDPEEAPGLTTVQETDCSCCPRHMTRLKALEAASLRDEEREDKHERFIHSRASVRVCQATARPLVLLSLQEGRFSPPFFKHAGARQAFLNAAKVDALM